MYIFNNYYFSVCGAKVEFESIISSIDKYSINYLLVLVGESSDSVYINPTYSETT